MTTDIDRGSIDVGGAHEPSYYEIALTNRQVVVAFVILLTCVVAAFFSGVWIGRESSARTQERLALLARGHAGPGSNRSDRVDAMGNPVADKDKPEGQALQEFKFFADSRRHPGAPGGPGADTKGTPAATEPASAANSANSADSAPPAPAEAQRSRTSSPPVSPAPAQTTGGGAAGRPGHPAAGASSPGAAPAARAAAPAPGGVAPGDDTPAGEGEPLPASPAPSSRRTGANAGSGATKAAAATGGQSGPTRPPASSGSATSAGSAAGSGGAAVASGEVVIQVFSTADREQADRVRDGLADAGFAAFLSPIAKGAQTMYRVRIGPFASKADAEAVAEKVRKERKLDTWITPK